MDAWSVIWVVTTGNKGMVLGAFTDPLAVARYLTDNLAPHSRVVTSYLDGAGLRHVSHMDEKDFLATV